MFAFPSGSIAQLAFGSARSYFDQRHRGAIHRSWQYLGKTFAVEGAGNVTVFRQTVNDMTPAGEPVVLVVGFRLKGIRSIRAAHWLFQRACLATTPFWSGLPGFKVKLWMVDPESKSYLGIYDWRGEADAGRYVTALIRILIPLSTRDSVWHRLYPAEELVSYLEGREISSDGFASSA